MIKVLDQTALMLIAPSVKVWDHFSIIKNPQAIHYIDCSNWDGGMWKWALISQPLFEDKCTEYGGWAKMGSREWSYLLRERPQFAKYRT